MKTETKQKETFCSPELRLLAWLAEELTAEANNRHGYNRRTHKPDFSAASSITSGTFHVSGCRLLLCVHGRRVKASETVDGRDVKHHRRVGK